VTPISAVSPVQSDSISTPSPSSNASSNSSETRSFASYLKESSTKEETHPKTGPAGLKSATKDAKEPRRNKPDTNGALLTAMGVMPQANDPRPMLLSLQKSSGEEGDTAGTDHGKAAGVVPKPPAPVEPTAALQKSQIAFSLTLPKTAVPAEKPLLTDDDKAAGVVPKTAAPVEPTAALQKSQLASSFTLPKTAVPAEKPLLTDDGKAAGVVPKAAAPVEPTAALQKSQLASSLTLPKTAVPGEKPPLAKTDSAGDIASPDKASPISRNSAGGKQHSDTSDSGNADSFRKTGAASGSTSKTTDFAPVVSAASAAGGFVPAMAPGQASLYPDSNPGRIASPPAAAEVARTADLPPIPVSRPPQSIDLKVQGTDNSEVDVRISQRAGEVQMTVRTPDSDLADSLRQHLPELSDRLAQSGVQGDIWHPGTAQVSADTASNQESWTSGQSPGQQQQQRSPDGRPQQSQENENGQSNWQNEFNTSEKEDS
jgi:hypothetical protein